MLLLVAFTVFISERVTGVLFDKDYWHLYIFVFYVSSVVDNNLEKVILCCYWTK